MNSLERAILVQVVDYYLNSPDYNGMILHTLAKNLGADPESLMDSVIALVQQGQISISSPFHGNPYIKAFDASIDEQLHMIEERKCVSICLYPTAESIRSGLDPSLYDDTPFTKAMVLVTPQLAAWPFRIDVLDYYERDPRYKVTFYDFGGRIQVPDENYSLLEASDRMELRFGVGYDDSGERVVAVYTSELCRLPGRHQRIWKEYLLNRKCKMAEEYFTTTILGQPVETVSTYEAAIMEQVEINKLFRQMGRTPLFRNTYEEFRRPRGFSFFTRPTQGEYDSFVILLDKMLSDNIDVRAFGQEISQKDRVEISQGEFNVRRKGSITMLKEWLTLQFSRNHEEEILGVIAVLRQVRKQRQKPAHTIVDDKYDKSFYDRQDKQVWEVYCALRKLRNLLMKHPCANEYEPPYWDGLFAVKNF